MRASRSCRRARAPPTRPATRRRCTATSCCSSTTPITSTGRRTRADLLPEPVAQRLDGGAGLDEGVAHGGHDLLGARAVAVDADGVDLRGDHLPVSGPPLALHPHAPAP